MKRLVVAEQKLQTLGTVLRGIRTRNGWTLKEMSNQCGIPVSTLSKVEHDRLTLTYDKLQQLSRRLNIRMSDLFAEGDEETVPIVMGMRSIATLDNAVRVVTDNYDYNYLCTDLRQKRMIPIVTRIRARSAKEFGALVRHQGEEFIYVIEGRIEVHSEFYDPVLLEEGQGIYLDSSMGHAYVVGKGCDEALVLGVCSSTDENLQDSLMGLRT
jgi:transcriptional regulator with XRE-family HTH domain